MKTEQSWNVPYTYVSTVQPDRPTAVSPEPGTLIMLAVAFVVLLALRKIA